MFPFGEERELICTYSSSYTYINKSLKTKICRIFQAQRPNIIGRVLSQFGIQSSSEIFWTGLDSSNWCFWTLSEILDASFELHPVRKRMFAISLEIRIDTMAATADPTRWPRNRWQRGDPYLLGKLVQCGTHLLWGYFLMIWQLFEKYYEILPPNRSKWCAEFQSILSKLDCLRVIKWH